MGDETEEAAMGVEMFDDQVRLNDQERNDIRIVAGFLNAYHGVFQRYLDEELKIDPAEAEVIIDNLNSLTDLDD